MDRSEQFGYLSATTDARDTIMKFYGIETDEHTKKVLSLLADELLANYDAKIK